MAMSHKKGKFFANFFYPSKLITYLEIIFFSRVLLPLVRRVLYIRFDRPFQIHDDADLLRLMRLYKAPLPELHELISEDFRSFITEDFHGTP
jgi:hypothetical protein